MQWMNSKDLSRRQFMIELGLAGALRFDAPKRLVRGLVHSGSSSTVELHDAGKRGLDCAASLYNKNWQTAIGLRDEPASIVDRFGQLRSDEANVPSLANSAMGGGSRNVKLLIEIGEPSLPV